MLNKTDKISGLGLYVLIREDKLQKSKQENKKVIPNCYKKQTFKEQFVGDDVRKQSHSHIFIHYCVCVYNILRN